MSKLAKDMTLGELIEHCKSFKSNCIGCDFMNRLGGDFCCLFRLSLPELWDIDSIQVATNDEDVEKIYENFKDLSDEKKIEFFKNVMNGRWRDNETIGRDQEKPE